MHVYEVVTTNLDGSMNHCPTLFLHRSAAKRYVESIEDRDPKYGPRWKVRIDRKRVEEEP